MNEIAEFNCPVEVTLDLIGGKWKPLIMWHLSQGTLRFGELQRLIPRVTHKMLSQHLRALEADGLIIRKVYSEVPPRVEYSLSDLGISINPILEAMCNWGNDYLNRLSKTGCKQGGH